MSAPVNQKLNGHDVVMDDVVGIENQAGMLSLPIELIHNILLSLPPLSVEHFSQTCKLARRYVYADDNQGDSHLWRRIYLQRFDYNDTLWPISPLNTPQLPLDDEQDEASSVPSLSSSRSSSSSSVASASSSSSSTASTQSVMSMVQTRERATRLYQGDPTQHGPMALNYNSVLTALLSVIDTAVPDFETSTCRNSVWLNEGILKVHKQHWSGWVFPRNLIHSLRQFKIKNGASNAAQKPKNSSGPESKRRRLTGDTNEDGASAAAEAGSSSSIPSRSRRNSRPDSTRRRSARLLKLMYPEELHDLIDEGFDIDAFAEPDVRLAARLHCLHGIRTWKDSQKQRQTTSPQEIPGQRAERNNDPEAVTGAGSDQAAAANSIADPMERAGQAQTAADLPVISDNGDANRTEGGRNDVRDEAAVGDEAADNESFDEPPAHILGFRPRLFGPSFGFCAASEEEDKVRARMREQVYDAGNYGWCNSYGPLHPWRIDLRTDLVEDEDEDEDDDDFDEAEERGQEGPGAVEGDEPEPNGQFGHDGGSDGEDEDMLRDLDENDDDDDEIPDDPIPIMIETSSDEGHGRTFRVADQEGNVVEDSATRQVSTDNSGWDYSDEDEDEPSLRRRFEAPSIGTYDADSRTYTYEGGLPVGISTGSDAITITLGGDIDFRAAGELHIRLIQPGRAPRNMRVTSGGRGRTDFGNEDGEADQNELDQDMNEEDEIDQDDLDEMDDDFEATDEEDEDDMISIDFDSLWTPMTSDSLTRGHAGSYVRQEMLELKSKLEKGEGERAVSLNLNKEIECLRKKAVHWELLEAIMVVMYANLKEAIWLENWGVGIKIPKVCDADGMVIHDPMEKREFLEFPTGWASSLPNPLPPRPEAKAKGNANQQVHGGADDSRTAKHDHDEEKPYDWARCESFWGGTYAFLDYSNYMYFNARVARRRRELALAAQDDRSNKTNKNDSKAGAAQSTINSSSSSRTGLRRPSSQMQSASTPAPSLLGHEEAVGDCLQLRLELLPKSQQPSYEADKEGQPDDPDYPTLYFRGTTVTYWGNEAPMPRGGVHGRVRPVYEATDGPGKRRIEGLQWSLVHVYDGEDRWQLEGIQPGPPGTKAPIFGIWTDAMHEDQSPNGPFVYWMMDERPWKEIEEINRKEREAAAARNARAAFVNGATGAARIR